VSIRTIIVMVKTSMLREERTEAVVLAAIVFLVLFCNSLFPPILPSLANEFAVSPLQLKWLSPGFSLTYGAATLVYGISSDRVGRALILKCLLLSAAVVVTGLSIVSTAHQLIVLRCISGLGIGGIVTVALSSVGDRYPYRLQGRPMGVMFGVITAGMGLGASVGPMMSETIGWRWTLRIIAAGFLIGALWAHGHYAGQTQERLPKANIHLIIEEYSCVLNAPRGLRPLIFIIANGAFHGGIFAWLGLLIVERYRFGEFGVGAVMIGYGLPDLLVGGVIGGLADRFGRRYTVPAGFIWAAICAMFLAASWSWWMFDLVLRPIQVTSPPLV
jgi:predicted MFS family arabinose efflux permease